VPNPFAVASDLQGSRIRASFHGASHGRLYADWGVRALSPDREVRYAIRDLRARARDLVRNNPYATGVVESFADNIIGAEPGIRLRPTVRGPDGNPAKDVNRIILDGWQEWGHPEFASVDGMESWTDLQRLIIKTWVTDGEVFIREHRGYRNSFAYAIQIIDADLLDETFNVPADRNGVEIRMGIEMDRLGRRLAYHFWKQHPSDGPRERARVPANEIHHFFVRYRSGQTRGFSLFAPVLTTVKMIDGLTEAELVASRLAAAKMGFITNMTPEAIEAYAQRLAMMNAEGAEDGEIEPRISDIAPGLMEELLPGQGFQGFDPTHPNTAFDPFLKTMLRGVARGFSMSYLTLTGDVGEANYSSMRAGLLPERDHWRIVQLQTTGKLHRPVYRGWMASALLTGALQLPTSVPSDYASHKWRPRGWKWVDPLKDILALDAAIDLGIDSRQHGAAEQGRDFFDTVDELAEEEEYATERGINIWGKEGWDQAQAANEPPAKPNGNGSSANGNGRGGRRADLNRISKLLEATHGQD